jgi:S1-C subfamily serine protease
MQILIQCSSCGIDLSVEQSAGNSVYCCPSCGAHFQVAAPQADQVGSDSFPESLPRKPKLLTPTHNPAPIQPQAPPTWRPGVSSYNQTTLPAKSTDKTIPIIIGSIAALVIVCITLVIINSNKSGPTPTTQVETKPTKVSQAERRKEVEEKAKEFLEASSESVERSIEVAKEEQKAFEEEQSRERDALAEIYGDKFFDGDHDAGYQLVVELEEVIQSMPRSEDEAQELLVERMKNNPVLKPFVNKSGDFTFADKNNQGPMAFLKQYKSFGTGFFITADGWIVSNRHVVGDAKLVDIRMSDGSTHSAKVMKTDKEFDLALIKAEAKAPKCLPISKGEIELGLGRPVFTIGFPNPILQGVEPKYTDGKVSALAGMGDDKNFYQVSVPVQPGNSGGALVDNDTGWVVGVITLRLDNTSDGRSAQNVSYAIKSAALNRFIESYKKSESEEIKIASSSVAKPGEFIELAKHSAVQILIPKDDTTPSEE